MTAIAAAAAPAVAAGSRRAALYLSIGLVAGAVIALQIFIMRVFAVGSWTHFGSLVVSLAMLGFGLASAVMCIGKDWFDRRWRGASVASLLLFGPLVAACHLLAQQVPFNAIFVVSDPEQKWRLLANFVLYFVPFLSAAVFIGTVFLKNGAVFGRIYFADLAGAGLAGLTILGAMFVLQPSDLILVPLLLWLAGAALWLVWIERPRLYAWLAVAAVLAGFLHFAAPGMFGLTRLAVSDYKGIAYAQKFPDSAVVYHRASPFGDLSIYASSYLHFAPGLSDNAAFNLPQMPANAYLGMYVDGEGPNGIMRELPPEETAYFRFLPAYYPYLLKQNPRTFIVQFGGGISARVALRSGAESVTVAEGNPAILTAFAAPEIRAFTGDILADPRVRVIPYEGRLFLAKTDARFDVIDLSLADSVGLSSPGGFAVTEKYAYTQEAMASYMRALADGGVLSVTVWNREEPAKGILKLYATMAAAARDVDAAAMPRSFFVAATYLSTTTVLYKRGGFTEAEIATLRDHTRAMSFDEIYSPGFVAEGDEAKVLAEIREQIFGDGGAADAMGLDADAAGSPLLDPAGAGGSPLLDPASAGSPLIDPPAGNGGLPVVPATTLARLAWQAIAADRFGAFADAYVFDISPLTNNRPYFAAYVRPADLPKTLDRLDLFQDDWGYLAVWATLAIAALAALVLLLVPVVFGWRTIFSRTPGKLGTLAYFACLGAGYMLVEVGLIGKFVLALGNATISAAVLITGMLVFSGLGALVSERLVPAARARMPLVFLAIGALLLSYGLVLDAVLDAIGTQPYGLRLVLAMALIAPPSFLMGMPLPTAMTSLSRLGKEPIFLWAWGINGCFSVIGAAAVPVLATAFGLAAVLQIAGVAYLLAWPAFLAVLKPMPRPRGIAAPG